MWLVFSDNLQHYLLKTSIKTTTKTTTKNDLDEEEKKINKKKSFFIILITIFGCYSRYYVFPVNYDNHIFN